MSQSTKWGKTLRIVVIVLAALTAAFMLLGGIGTTCVAWGAEKYPPFRGLVSWKWLYQASSVITIATGALGLWFTAGLVRGRRDAYKWTVILLAAGLLVAGSQMIVSEMVRGKSAPNSMRVYITAFTLIVLLLLRIPGIWQRTGLDQPGGGTKGPAGGLAAIVAGMLTLSVPMWAGPTHIVNGFNLVLVLKWPLLIGGSALTVLGVALLIAAAMPAPVLDRQGPVPVLAGGGLGRRS